MDREGAKEAVKSRKRHEDAETSDRVTLWLNLAFFGLKVKFLSTIEM